MRIYIPITAQDLVAEWITPRGVHAVTGDLRGEFPREDVEALEMVAALAAADDSFRRIATDELPDRRRVVAVAEVSAVEADPHADLPTVMRVVEPVEWTDVQSFYVDETGGEELVEQALSGGEKEFLALGEIDLLWYDVVERQLLYAELITR